MIIPKKTCPSWGEANIWEWNGFCCNWRMLGKENTKDIVLIHGFGASSEHWRFNAHFLASNGFKVYALDLIGFGRSEQPKLNKLDNEFWAHQVAGFLKDVVHTTNFKKAILVGNSLGGLTAITTAALYSDLISSVIAAPLPDPALMPPIFGFPVPKWIKKLKVLISNLFFKLLPLEIFLPLITKTKLIKLFLQLAYKKSIKSDLDLQRIVKHPAQRPGAARALRSMCIGMSNRKKTNTAPSLLEHLSKEKVRPKILLIWGREDNLVPLSIARRLIKEHPWLKLFVLENTGHCPHDESPTIFNQYVLNWLKVNSQAIYNEV